MKDDRLISLNAAIDAVEKSRRLNHHQDGKAACAHEYEHRHFLKILRDLPSAQPGWIPCKTALPKEDGQYIVTLKDDKEVWTDIAEWNPTFGGRWQAEFFDCEYRDINNVVAWQPLPTPYREGGRE